MKITTDYDEKKLEDFLQSHPKSHFMQSFEWTRVKANWKHEFVVAYDDKDNIIGAMMVLIRKVPGLPYTLMYSPRGPVCDVYNLELMQGLINKVRELAKKYKVSTSAVNKHCRLEKWVEKKEEKKKEIDKEVAEKTKKSVIDKKVAANEKHNELFSKGLEVAELLLNQYLSELHEGKKKTKASAYNLDFVMKAIANAQKGQRLSVNIDKEETVTKTEPELRIINGIDINDI